jgi:hypothetical protein
MANMFANRKVTNYIINHLEKNGLSAPVQRATQSDSHYITVKLPSEHHDALEESGFDFDKTRKIRISDHANPSSHSDYSIRTDADEHKNYGWRTLANQVLNDFNPELSFISKLPKKPKTQTEPQQLTLPQIGSKVSHRSFGEGTVVGYTPNGVSVSFNGNEQNIHPAYLSQISKADGGEVDGITAYHGSPHEFDQFDLSKIGTGEGAQAYGRGLYFAESEPIAQHYRDALANKKTMPGNQASPLKTAWSLVGGNPNRVAMPTDDLLKYVKQAWPNTSDEELRAAIDTAKSQHSIGHMYEVSINAHPDHFLDWDKPLSEQSSHVQNAIEKIQKKYGLMLHPKMNGSGLYDEASNSISNTMAKSDKEASDALHEHGIKGIKYLDAGSRGKGEGSRNYVVFDDKLVNVKRRYARGGMVEGYADGGAPEEIDTSYLANLWRGLQSIPEVAYNYLKDTPYEQMGSDAVDLGKHVYNDITENPIENLVTALPVVGSGKAAYDAYQINNRIQQAYKEGNHEDAKKLERALALSSLGAIPIFGELSSVGAGAARLVEDATLNGVTRAATRAATRAITNSLPQDAYQAAESMISETLSDAVKAARKRMFVGETDAKKSDKSGKYAHGGYVQGYDNGGSVSDAILKYAESLPTVEENIEALKQFGLDVGEGAANLGNRIYSGFEKMAEKASERPRASGPIDPTQIARFEQLQRKQLEDEAQKMRDAPPSTSQRRYILPDGRMGSKAELDLANEMAHERFSEQHAMPPVVQENMPSLDRPAPTRAPMRERIERQANVDRPVDPIASKTFRQAFSDARSRGDKTFSWTNPATGKSAMYHTMLARKEGGRIPAMNNPDEWLADQNESKKDAVKKKNKSAPKAERNPIVSRALMVSSRKS